MPVCLPTFLGFFSGNIISNDLLGQFQHTPGREPQKKASSQHTMPFIIYTQMPPKKNERRPERPREIPEESQLEKKAIRVLPLNGNPRLKLDPSSRLNYSKIYTVEHITPVHFIGTVDDRHADYLKRDYNLTHQALPESSNFVYARDDSECEDN